MTAELIALLESDPAAGILAVAELRERRAKAATQGPWAWEPTGQQDNGWGLGFVVGDDDQPLAGQITVGDGEVIEPVAYGHGFQNAQHIAAEANPEHALAAVRRWRGVAERHKRIPVGGHVNSDQTRLNICEYDERHWPCADLTETADEARAYLGAS